MGKIKLQRRKIDSQTSGRIARLWRASKASDIAEEGFFDAVTSLLHAGRLAPAKLDRIIGKIPEEDSANFLAELNEIATTTFDAGVWEAGEVMLCRTELFAIPVVGNVRMIEAMVDNEDIIQRITQTIRDTGFSPHTSNVLVLPRALSPEILPELHPQLLHDLTTAAAVVLGGDAVATLADGEQEHLLALLPEDDQPAEPGEVVAGTRFLIGARLIPIEPNSADDTLDGIALQDHVVSDEEADQLARMVEAWDDEMAEVAPDVPFWIEQRRPWRMIAISVIQAHILLNIFVALTTEEMDAAKAAGGPDTDGAETGEPRRLNPYEEVEELTLDVDPAKVHISAIRDGQPLTTFAFPVEVLGPYGLELIETLEGIFPVSLAMADGTAPSVGA